MRLKDYREKYNLSQLDISKVLGVDVTTISKYETRDIFPSLKIFKKIQEITDQEVTIEDFLP